MRTRFLTTALLTLLAMPAAAGKFFIVEEPGDLSGTMGRASSPRQLGANAGNPLPPANFVGQYYTTPALCTYSRVEAPGYATSWYLVMNPHHIGQPNANPSCPTRL